MPPTVRLSADEIIARLGLRPLPIEGGYFAESYRTEAQLPPSVLPPDYPGPRALATGIYYLLTPSTCSILHRLRGDEVYHFYLGDPVELLQLLPDGQGELHRLGTDLAQGERPQVVVRGGTWQGSRLAPGGQVALLGTTMAPGFHPADFEAGERAALLRAYPRFGALIEALTPSVT